MKHFGMFLAALLCSSAVEATVTVFTSSADFHAANPGTTLIEDFEDSDPSLRDASLSSYTGPGGEISFTPISSYPYEPNLVLASPGYPDEGAGPNTSVIITSTGNEDFIATLASPAYSLGFDVFLNDSPLALSFFSGDTLLATLNFDVGHDGNHNAFAGITSTDGITSFHLEAINGQYRDTSVDNIYVGAAGSVPEPATWAMMLVGFGAVGVSMRRRRLIPRCA